MGHVDACGPSACPARFRTTSCEWTNGPHAGPIMRSTRKPMRGRPRGPPLVHGPGRTMASLSTGPRSKVFVFN